MTVATQLDRRYIKTQRFPPVDMAM
jgi:hypothetical protein